MRAPIRLKSFLSGLKLKLAVPGAFLVLSVTALGLTAEVFLSKISENLRETTQVSSPLMQDSQKMESNVHEIVRYVWGVYGSGLDLDMRSKQAEYVRNAMTEFEAAKKDFESRPSSREAQALYKPIPELWAKLKDVTDSTMETLAKNNPRYDEMAKFYITSRIRTAALPLTESLAKLTSFQSARQASQAAHSVDQALFAKNFIAILNLLTVLVTAGILGALAVRLTRQLTEVVEHIGISGEQVNSASSQLAGASQRLSSSATEAAASIEQTTAAIEELAKMIHQNAQSAKAASDLSKKASTSAEDGEAESQQLSTAMSDISTSSKRIVEIITVIDDIAFQTNLLALNAAVEAARAGEQGKGFAVVADAVRDLAQRSSSAAKDIAELIKTSAATVEQGTKIAEKSGTVLKSIAAVVKKVADLNGEIALASEEQAKGVTQVNATMSQLDTTTQENAASAEEVAASSEALQQESHALREQVDILSTVVSGKAFTMGSPEAQRGPEVAPRTAPRKKSKLRLVA